MIQAMRAALLPMTLLLAVMMLAACASHRQASAPDYSLYLVRHAEKAATPPQDPDLTDAGRQRARTLASRLQDASLQAIWSSPYARTRQTAAPSAESLNLPVQEYDPRDLPALVTMLREKRQTALVVGHSNTTPELAALLSGEKVEAMPETEYNRWYRVDFYGDEVVLQTLDQRDP